MNKLLAGHLMAAIVTTLFGGALQASAQDVRITNEIMKVEYGFNGNTYAISRDQDPNARIPDAYALTSRPCPEFCVQPITIHEGVNTYGELELLSFLQEKVNQGHGFLIDSRTSDWYAKGTIPGAVNLPFNAFVPGPDNAFFDSLMVMLSGKQSADGNWEFSDPKDLLLFCNGPWCGQSPTAIRNLLAINYPAEKLHYYRGGMQSWVSMGFTVEVPN
ncbi:rhodanese-like domain-containing protein [Profundibacter sp.]|uniref:rhodanese-like domain-containing protein n=1 Tax=Profundibacter sp. TaxID=3101071 RepID=UPI003D0CE7F8